jgi:exodeoxyribonuclease VII large subunit
MTPLSYFLTRRTSRACSSGVMFLWMMPMPPSCASAMARRASVTVSIAAETSGRFSRMLARQRVERSTSRGSTSSRQVPAGRRRRFLVRGRVSLYEPRGDFQFIVEHMEEAGAGALQRAYEELKAKLAAEGLFDESLKRPLPTLPHRIGVITSPSGAAIRDILSVLERRFPTIPVIVYPVPVQGDGSAERIVAALQTASARAECDVLLLSRGGGSIEDLWSFNDERVARAIRACTIPVVSGVGHEIDFTIADFAADHRAPTPSAAAELVVPDRTVLKQRLVRTAHGLKRALVQHMTRASDRVNWLATRLQQLHPGRRLQQQAQRLDELEQRLHRSWATIHATAAARVTAAARTLNAVSPLATLTRGYAIITIDGTRHRHQRRNFEPGRPGRSTARPRSGSDDRG